MTSQNQSIDEYVDSFPAPIQMLLRQLRQIVRESAPEATETISYRIPTFKLNGSLVHFAAFKDHISFFPTSSGINAFKDELKSYKTAKGTVQFPLDKPIPSDLIRRIIRFRVHEQRKK